MKNLLFGGLLVLSCFIGACGGGSTGGTTTASTDSSMMPTPSGSGSVTQTVNVAPIARAGTDISVVVGSQVMFNGSGSSDANNDPLTYSWTFTSKPSGSAAVLIDSRTVRPYFTSYVQGTYVATLVVNDGKLDSSPSSAIITFAMENAAPVANAGRTQNVINGSLVTLDGTQSSDANKDALTYSWTLASIPAGSKASLTGITTSKPTFIADLEGTYSAILIVNDGKLYSQPSLVTIAASAANAVPVANAGLAQKIGVGAVAHLDGSRSSDSNGDQLSYLWTLTSKPVGSSATLTLPTSVKTDLTADKAGDYVASLTVNDGKTDSDVSTVLITATAPTITLWTVADGVFNPQDKEEIWPYLSGGMVSASVSCIGSGCATAYDLAKFKLQAIGQSFTIINLLATNRTSGSSLVPVFVGLAEGQVIASGQTVPFRLQSPFTGGKTVNLNYSFTVKETGQTFSFGVLLTTN